MPDRGRLARAELVVLRGDVRVERARGAERDREDRAVAVDRVVGEQDRDVQPRLLDRPVLVLVDLHRVDEAEDAADRLVGPRRVPLIWPSESSWIWFSFSCSVIFLMSESIRRSMSRLAAPARRLQRRLVARLRRCHDASRQCRARTRPSPARVPPCACPCPSWVLPL